MPGLISDLAKIPDPRNPLKVKHKLTVLLLYGILAFVFQFSSRREAGKEMSHPVFFQNLQALLPELETLPHQDTLCRLLERIAVDEIEEAHLSMFERLEGSRRFA
ncbi:transposase family protein [Paenibacillus naphthalenovorans]|uniref:transposase family protein n=1 Tax=Paenibacillus naphthalenovorans TaxID=162209 RepID=UPI003D27BE3C